ncbi:MAG: hypothetical protein N2115_03465 [bacterium]|nr:hypothetical protein [bacterium]
MRIIMFQDLKPGKHLVVDNFSIADTFRLRRTVHKPKKDPSEPVLIADKPWETAVIAGKIIYDDKKELWRMWYVAYDHNAEKIRKSLGKSKYGNVGEPQTFFLCYAESKNGINWEKPVLDVYPGTNICFKGYSDVVNATILYQPDRTEDGRYILINRDWYSDQIGGIYIAKSRDGIHWKYTDTKPVIHGESDCNNACIFNPEKQVYMLYMRGWHTAAVGWDNGKGNQRRRITYAESKDLRLWSEPQVILSPDELDTNDFYGISVFRYANAYLGMLWIFDDDMYETIDVELCWSRDGIRWERHPERPKFIETEEKGEIGGYMVYPAQEPVIYGNTLYLFVNAHSRFPHNHQPEVWENIVYRTKLRMDGFITLDAGSQMGNLITRPFVLQSDKIVINAATQGGYIIAELAEPYWYDPKGKIIEGFSASDFDVFTGDSTNHILSWRGCKDLSCLKGKRLMLRMAMVHSQIYSFTI